MINGIESAIDRVVNQLPVGQTVQQDIRKAFVELLDRVVTESVTGAAAPAATHTPVTATQLLPEAKAAATAGSTSLLTDLTLPGLEQLSDELTAADPAYNEREGELRSRLNVPELERRLRCGAPRRERSLHGRGGYVHQRGLQELPPARRQHAGV